MNETTNTDATPEVTVAVMSDYRAGEGKSWDDIRKTLRALARQDNPYAAEFLLLDTGDELDAMPEDVAHCLPGLRLVAAESGASYALKNAAAHAARAETLLVLDADCEPAPGWIRAGVEALRTDPRIVAVSGRTSYPGRTTLERALGLLSRSYVDRGKAAPTRLVSTNNMAIRTRALREHPLPEDEGGFAYRVWSEAALRRGERFWFEPAMRAVHDFEGWPMERDMRRQVGWTSIRIRQMDEHIPGAAVVRALGPLSIPLLYVYRLVESTGRCLRLTGPFGLRWYHLPMLLALMPVVHAFEIPGMLNALRNRSAGATVYR